MEAYAKCQNRSSVEDACDSLHITKEETYSKSSK